MILTDTDIRYLQKSWFTSIGFSDISAIRYNAIPIDNTHSIPHMDL